MNNDPVIALVLLFSLHTWTLPPRTFIALCDDDNLLPIEIPPSIITPPAGDNEQALASDDAGSPLVNLAVPSTVNFLVILRSLLNLTLPLNVTGPLNWDRICWDGPPSTSNLFLIITSSNTTLNVLGSSPVTVGTGISNVICSPESDEILVFPI